MLERTNLSFAIWERAGVTEHLGGIAATRRLLAMGHLAPGARVLEIGCGTGYTACQVARAYQAHVLALDITVRSVTKARQRVIGAKLAHQVTCVQADAHHLPCPAGCVDLFLAESVLVFGDVAQLLAEAYRVLKPGGVLLVNELTLRAPPPEQLATLLTEKFGIPSYQERDWRIALQKAGFSTIRSELRPFKLWEQAVSHLQVDGLAGYLSAVVRSLQDRSIRRSFINREIVAIAQQCFPYIGYGLYVGQKAT